MKSEPIKPFNDSRVEEYKQFDKVSFSWQFLEWPAIEGYTTSIVDEDAVVLDLGCGTGRVGAHLLQLGLSPKNLFGIDISDSMITEARQRVPSAHFVQGEGSSLPYPDEIFDIVVSNVVLHLMDAEGLDKTLKEVGRVLKPGGSYVFVESNPYQDPKKLHLNEWVTTQTPWGVEISVFQHDYNRVLERVAVEVGLTCSKIEFPQVDKMGQSENPAEYERYTARNLRISALLQKQL